MKQGIKNKLDALEKKLKSNSSKCSELIIYDKEENIPKEITEDNSIQVRMLIPDNGRNPNFDQEKHYVELIKRSRARRKALGLPEWRDTSQGIPDQLP